MTLLIAAIIVATIGGVWVIYPLVYRRWASLSDVVPASVIEGEARRYEALAALKEVEYDRAAGKLDDQDYADLRGQLEMEALSALRSSPPGGGAVAAGALAHSCGFLNPAGSRFCAGCGSRLG